MFYNLKCLTKSLSFLKKKSWNWKVCRLAGLLSVFRTISGVRRIPMPIYLVVSTGELSEEQRSPSEHHLYPILYPEHHLYPILYTEHHLYPKYIRSIISILYYIQSIISILYYIRSIISILNIYGASSLSYIIYRALYLS